MPRAVNWGFYFQLKPRQNYKDPTLRGRYLHKDWQAFQHLGNSHSNEEWDYSQLLQLMRNLKHFNENTNKWEDQVLKQALLDGNPLVWDEGKPGQKPNPANLSFPL